MNEQNKLFTSEKIQFKFITNENKFLKIYGIRKKAIQFDLNRLGEIFGAQEYKADYVPIRESLYVAKIDNEYERVKVAAIDDVAGVAYVTLLDAGNSSAAVPFHQLRPIASLSAFSNPKSYCNEYYLAGIVLNEKLDRFHCQELLNDLQVDFKRHELLELTVVAETVFGTFVRLAFNDNDLISSFLLISTLQKGFVETVSIDSQIKMITDYKEANELKKQRQQQQMKPIARNLKPAAPPKFSRLTPQNGEEESFGKFNSNVIPHNSVHKVRITHYERGINLFYVHMEALDANLQNMTSKIQGIFLKNLKKRPSSLGMACLAKYQRKVYRVAVAKSNEGQPENLLYLCHFVDFGFSAQIKFDNLFYIPHECVAINAFAVPFCLTALKNVVFQTNMTEINYYFQQITENRLLTLKCVPLDGPPICQYCEIYEDDVNILNSLKMFDPSSFKYPIQDKLDAKKAYNVKVCYIASVQEFYIQLEDPNVLIKYDLQYYELERLMPKAPPLHQLKIGQCCGVQIELEWFRGQVIGLNRNGGAKVLVIDFGIIEEFPAKSIRLLTNKFTDASAFAYRCCLKGFESEGVSENINTQFDIFCSDGKGERRVFKMLINNFDFERGYIVELDDESVRPTANVNKILLKNSRPLAETITLENAKKRQKESQQKNVPTSREAASTNTNIPKAQVAVEFTKEVKSPDRNRNASQRGRSNHTSKGNNQRSTPIITEYVDSRRQRTHFDKFQYEVENNREEIYFQTPREANLAGSSSKQQQKSPSPRKTSKSPKSSPEKKQKEQKSPLKREKSTVENEQALKEKSPPKKLIKLGWVSMLHGVNEAYVHFEEHVDGLEKLLNEIFDFYESQEGSFIEELQEGLKCALRSKDCNWYRGEIKQIKGDTCRVFNLEYGNLEIVHKTNLRVLDQKFLKVEKLIERAFFPIKPNKDFPESDLLKEMQSVFNEGVLELNFEIIKKFKDGSILEVIDSSSKENLFDKLVARKLAVRIGDDELDKIIKQTKCKEDDFDEIILTSVPNEPLSDRNEDETKEEVGEEETDKKVRSHGKITAMTSPTDFCLVCSQGLISFNQIHTDIQILAPALPPLLDFKCETLCLAQQPYDNFWYRAKIIDSDDNSIITVMCVDVGKTFSIENKLSLKVLPEQLQRKTFLGISCSLPLSIEHALEEEATELLLTLVDTEIEFEVVLCTPDKTYVEIFSKNDNVGQQLIEKNLAKRFEIFQSGPCFTSHINSLNDFYIQLEEHQFKLDLIADIMDKAKGNFEKVKNPGVGQIVAAKFSDDDGWYRALIEEINADVFAVKFIDYGNLSETKDIGMLDETIIEMPQMSKRCRLLKPKNFINFSDAAEKKFAEICANGAIVLQVKVIKLGDVTTVELFCNGKNIIDSLASLCNHDNIDDY